MRIERHVFGSFSGYTTLAKSAGVSLDDCRQLESTAYSFGQSHDRGFIKSLAKTPAYFTRSMTGGRRGLTRVLEGEPDDNNRPTLRLITVILNQREWDSQLWGDVGQLLDRAELWQWDRTAAIPALDLAPSAPSGSVPRKSVPKLLALVSEVEKAYVARRPLVVSADDYGLAELRALEMLIPPAARRQFTSAFRGLSTQLPVSVNCLAPEAGSQGRAVFRYQAGVNGYSRYAALLESSKLTGGIIPVELVSEYRAFGASDTQAIAAGAPVAAVAPVITQRKASAWPLVLTGTLGVALAVGAFFAGRSVGTQDTRALEQAAQQEQVRKLNAEHRKDQDAALAQLEAAHADKARKTFAVEGTSYDDAIAAAAAKLSQTGTTAQSSQTALGQAKDERDKLRAFYDGEMNRQKARYERVKKQVQDFAGNDTRNWTQAQATLSFAAAELQSLQDEWPLASEQDRQWVKEMHALRSQVKELNRIANQVAHANRLLEGCEARMLRAGKGVLPSEQEAKLSDDLTQAHDAVNALPADVSNPAISLELFKKFSMARIEKVRQWLNEQDKERERLANLPTPPPPDPRNAGKPGEGNKGGDNRGGDNKGRFGGGGGGKNKPQDQQHKPAEAPQQ